jgi:ABC-type uncharacterized transport system auxiliary subunit
MKTTTEHVARRRRLLIALGAAGLLAAGTAGCVSVGIGNESTGQLQLRLMDGTAASVAARPAPLVPVLLVQAQPGDALADTLFIAYSRAPQQFAFYQRSLWTERPLRRVPRLLQDRLQARGVATVVGQLGDPLSSDWLLALRVDALHHDVSTPPGQAHVVLVAELFDRRGRQRVAQRRVAVAVPVSTADAPSAAAALSQALGQAFDQLVPWLETALAPGSPR